VIGVQCIKCGFMMDIEALLSRVSGHDGGTNSGCSSCPQCNAAVEFQVRAGKVVIGYSYSSGSLHFEGLFDVPAKGIKCSTDEKGVQYTFKGKSYRVPPN
jgi:hypothetical protein